MCPASVAGEHVLAPAAAGARGVPSGAAAGAVYPGSVLEEMPGYGHRRYPENCQSWPFWPVLACSDLYEGETQGFGTNVPNMIVCGSLIGHLQVPGPLKTGPEEPKGLFWTLSLV